MNPDDRFCAVRPLRESDFVEDSIAGWPSGIGSDALEPSLTTLVQFQHRLPISGGPGSNPGRDVSPDGVMAARQSYFDAA